MRYFNFCGVAGLALVLCGCASLSSTSGGLGDCTGHGSGPQPPIAPVSLSSVIENRGSGPHLNLKPQTNEVWGACVDGKSGNFHTFHKFANQVNIQVTFDKSLNATTSPPAPALASWPADATKAISQSDTPHGLFIPWATGTPYYSTASNGQQALNFTIQIPTPPGQKYYYEFNYIDQGGQPQLVEPSIQPH